jgi:hypothetical protein
MGEHLVLKDANRALERGALAVLARAQLRLVRPPRELAMRSELQRHHLVAREATTSTARRSLSRRSAEAELDVTYLAVAHLRWFQATDDAHVIAVAIVDDDEFDRVDALGHAAGGGATPTHKLGQLSAQAVVERFMEANLDDATLPRSQTEPIVEADRDLHARADQSPRPVRATQLHRPAAHPRTSFQVRWLHQVTSSDPCQVPHVGHRSWITRTAKQP